jgi:hypothetical protein
VCAAAQHAGVIPAGGGALDVTILGGQESYTGSERNGVVSSDRGSWERSFSVSPAGPRYMILACASRGQDLAGDVGATVTATCPAACSGAVWGTDIYTDDSSVCTAAVHAGAISAEGGIVDITILEGQESYAGSEQNGVTSSEWGSWERSFSVAPARAGE